MNYLQFKTKNTIVIKYKNRWRNITQLADELGVSYSFLYVRLVKKKESFEEVLHHLEERETQLNKWKQNFM